MSSPPSDSPPCAHRSLAPWQVRSPSAQSQRKAAIASCSWTLEESQVESCEHQDNADIHCQPFPESVSEEDEIYTDYDSGHRHDVKRDTCVSAHFRPNGPNRWARHFFPAPCVGVCARASALWRTARPILSPAEY